MRQNPQMLAHDQAPDRAAVEPASEAQAPVQHRIFHHDHPLIVEAKIRNGHLVLPASWRDDDDDEDYEE